MTLPSLLLFSPKPIKFLSYFLSSKSLHDLPIQPCSNPALLDVHLCHCTRAVDSFLNVTDSLQWYWEQKAWSYYTYWNIFTTFDKWSTPKTIKNNSVFLGKDINPQYDRNIHEEPICITPGTNTVYWHQYWVFPIRKLTKFRSSFPGVYCPLPSANTATYNYEVNHGRQNWLEEQILGTLYIRSMHPNFLHQIILNT